MCLLPLTDITFIDRPTYIRPQLFPCVPFSQSAHCCREFFLCISAITTPVTMAVGTTVVGTMVVAIIQEGTTVEGIVELCGKTSLMILPNGLTRRIDLMGEGECEWRLHLFPDAVGHFSSWKARRASR